MRLKSDEAKEEWLRRKRAMPDVPQRWDFHVPLKKIPLTREQKVQLQFHFSKLSKQELKIQLDRYDELRYLALRKYQDTFVPRWRDFATFCVEAKKFGEYYLTSLEWQKKI